MSEDLTPKQAARYVYDAAENRVAYASVRLAREAQRWGLERGHDRPFDLAVPMADFTGDIYETAPTMKRILCHTMVWRHPRAMDAWTVRIKNPEDVAVYLAAWPHLALDSDQIPASEPYTPKQPTTES